MNVSMFIGNATYSDTLYCRHLHRHCALYWSMFFSSNDLVFLKTVIAYPNRHNWRT
jgi:hypothetical protein